MDIKKLCRIADTRTQYNSNDTWYDCEEVFDRTAGSDAEVAFFGIECAIDDDHMFIGNGEIDIVEFMFESGPRRDLVGKIKERPATEVLEEWLKDVEQLNEIAEYYEITPEELMDRYKAVIKKVEEPFKSFRKQSLNKFAAQFKEACKQIHE